MSKGQKEKGSQKDIQLVFNTSEYKRFLENLLKSELRMNNDWRISSWISPVADAYKEYQDDEFMEKIGLGENAKELVGKFWPKGGPVWDGLAKANDGTILLFEAKAHISEMFSGGMKAVAKESRDMIQVALAETAVYIGAGYEASASWTGAMYQMANRLAHLYFLNKKIGVKAKLIYLIFLNDGTVVSHCETQEMWEAAIDVAERYILKLPFGRKARFKDEVNGSWRDWVKHVFIDMKKLDETII